MRLANLSDYQLQGCNRWALQGATKLGIAHTEPLFLTVPANSPVLPDVELATPSENDFLVKVVSFTGVTPGTLLQIQWPDGRYLSNPGLDFFSFVGTGRRGRLILPHKFCPRASKIRVNIDNSQVASVANIELYFEGVILVDLLS